MGSRKVSRRDFLKFAALSPLGYLLFQKSKSGLKSPWNINYRGSEPANLPNILVLVLDTLSAKHLSLYGYRRKTSPNLEKIADRATVFHRHYAGGNFTTPGTASLLTGVYPWSHRAFALRGGTSEEFDHRNFFSYLSPYYHTFAYTHNPLAYILLDRYREDISELTRISDLCLYADTRSDRFFQKDFASAYYAELMMLRKNYYPAGHLFASPINIIKRFIHGAQINRNLKDRFPRGVPSFFDEALPYFMYFTLEQAVDWLQVQLESQPGPFLGYVHLLPPHDPYNPRKEFIDIFDDGWMPDSKPTHFFDEGFSHEELVEKRLHYDESIAYVDAEIGRLYGMMERTGLLDNTYVFLTSDHGELFERGIYRHLTPTMFDPLLHIPLLISKPEQRQREDIYTPTSCVDLLPTLSQIAQLEPPHWSEGQVLAGFQDREPNPNRSIFAVEAKENPKNAPLNRATVVLIKNNFKLIYYFGYEGYQQEYELYDLEADPQELTNLYDPTDSLSVVLQDELKTKLSEVNSKYP